MFHFFATVFKVQTIDFSKKLSEKGGIFKVCENAKLNLKVQQVFK